MLNTVFFQIPDLGFQFLYKFLGIVMEPDPHLFLSVGSGYGSAFGMWIHNTVSGNIVTPLHMIGILYPDSGFYNQ
jgi:hypothetical protein